MSSYLIYFIVNLETTFLRMTCHMTIHKIDRHMTLKLKIVNYLKKSMFVTPDFKNLGVETTIFMKKVSDDASYDYSKT